MPPAERRRVLITATACVFANFLAFLGLTPLYPNVAHDLGLGVDGLGVYFGISSAIGVVLQIPVGVFADRVGRRPILTAGIFFIALAQLLRWQATTPLLFGASQLAIGLCSPFVTAPAYAIVADAFSRTGRAQALGVLQAGINLGQVAGFLAAGFLGPPLGWRGYSLVVAGLPVLLLPLTLTLPEPPRAPRTGSLATNIRGALRFLVLPSAGGLAIVAAVTLGSGFAANYLLPFIARRAGLTESTTSFLLVPYIVGSVIGAPAVGRWADRAGLRVPLVGALGFGALALAVFGLAGFSFAAVIVCFAAIGAGVSSALTIVASGVAETAAHSGAGTGAALGGLRVGQQLGPALGPALAGLAYVKGGSVVAFLGLGAALVLAAGVGFPSTTGRPRPAPGPAPT